MLQVFRTPRLACFALAAFLLAQPAAGCAVVCLLQRHHALHQMADMGGGTVATSGRVCHTGIADADHHSPVQGLSPMEPAHQPMIAVVPTDSIEPLNVLPTLPPQAPRTVETPPPRVV